MTALALSVAVLAADAEEVAYFVGEHHGGTVVEETTGVAEWLAHIDHQTQLTDL